MRQKQMHFILLNPLLPLLIYAGSQIFNSISGRAKERRDRSYQQQDYRQQLADNERLLKEQNTYNTPKNQIARFKEAGLNPALIYGTGSAAAGQSQGTNAPSHRSVETIAPQLDPSGLDLLMQNANIKVANAQADNLIAQNDVIKEDTLLKRATTAATLTNKERAVFDLEMEKGLQGTTAEFRKNQVREQNQNLDINMQRNEREAIMQSQNIQESVERIAKMRVDQAYTKASQSKIPAEKEILKAQAKQIEATIKNLDKDSRLKDLEIELNNSGLTKNDALWQRKIAQWLEAAGINVQETVKHGTGFRR